MKCSHEDFQGLFKRVSPWQRLFWSINLQALMWGVHYRFSLCVNVSNYDCRISDLILGNVFCPQPPNIWFFIASYLFVWLFNKIKIKLILVIISLLLIILPIIITWFNNNKKRLVTRLSYSKAVIWRLASVNFVLRFWVSCYYFAIITHFLSHLIWTWWIIRTAGEAVILSVKWVKSMRSFKPHI